MTAKMGACGELNVSRYDAASYVVPSVADAQPAGRLYEPVRACVRMRCVVM
jgi:hypothetical protein